jgi:hypothetical protein
MSDYSTSIAQLTGGSSGKGCDSNPENSQLVQDILNDMNTGNQQQQAAPTVPPVEADYNTQYNQSQDRLNNQQFDVLHNYDNEYDDYIQQNPTTTPTKKLSYDKIITEIKVPVVVFILVYAINATMIHRFIRTNILKIIGNDKYTVYGILVTKALIVSIFFYIITKFMKDRETL